MCQIHTALCYEAVWGLATTEPTPQPGPVPATICLPATVAATACRQESATVLGLGAVVANVFRLGPVVAIVC